MRGSVVEQNQKVEVSPASPRMACKRCAWLRRLWWVPILLLATATRFYGLTSTAIWEDEASSLLFSQYSPVDLWSHAARDVHPPLYFLLLRAWIELFGDGIFSVRSMSAIFGVFAVGLGTWLTRSIATRRAALMAGYLLALLPTAVGYSQDVRMYSMLSALLLGATLALVYWVRQPGRKRYWLAYVLLMTAGFYTHYFTALCVLVHWLWLALLGLNREPGVRLITRPTWWWANLVIALLYLPWLPNLLGLVLHTEQLKVGNDIGWADPVSLISLPAMIWQFLIQDDGFNLWAPLFFLVPTLMLCISGWVGWRDRSRYRFGSLLALYFLLPLWLVYGVSFVSPVFIDRYLTAYALGLPILVALFLDRLPVRFSKSAVVVLMLFAGVELAGLRTTFTVDVDDQFNLPVELVNGNYQQGDRIVISDMLWYLPYAYYDRTHAQLQLYTPPTAGGKSGRLNAYGSGTLVNEAGDRIYLDRLSELPTDSRRVWLISTAEAADEFAPLPNGWHQILQRDGGGARARLFVVCREPEVWQPPGCH